MIFTLGRRQPLSTAAPRWPTGRSFARVAAPQPLAPERMDISLDLLGNAVVSGLLLGGFYAAVTVGLSIAFGMLDIVNIAHPAFIVLGSYLAYIANSSFGIDPIVAGIALLPAFYVLGAV